jgi:hypothetical protein
MAFDRAHRPFAALSVAVALCLSAAISTNLRAADNSSSPFRIEVIDAENGWPVPLVELTTVHDVKFYTDNAGVVAFDLPELMGRETWLDVSSDGYEAPADGFGRRGVRVTPKPGESATIKVNRTSIAKRIGRITGAGIFGESQKLGMDLDWRESGVLGQDTVQCAEHRGRLYWAWGDTRIARYPLGIFDATGATTPLKPVADWKPPLKLNLDYFRNEHHEPRGIAKMPGKGPTWLSGLISLPDETGTPKLVASYVKIAGTLTAYETGLCVWNEQTKNFDHWKTLWSKSKDGETAPPRPSGNVVIVDDGNGHKRALFGSPFPALRCEATFEAWSDPTRWETLKPQETLKSAADGTSVKPHAGSIAWNKHRRRWITVFHEAFGKPSFLGEVWYAEADAPTGPWGPAVKVLSHKTHSFYNVRIHPELAPEDARALLFEGTYTASFSNAVPTPRYEYNQMMYRVDLDDPKLAPAQPK